MMPTAATDLASELTASSMTYQGHFLKQTTKKASGKLSFQEPRFSFCHSKCSNTATSNTTIAINSCRTKTHSE